MIPDFPVKLNKIIELYILPSLLLLFSLLDSRHGIIYLNSMETEVLDKITYWEVWPCMVPVKIKSF